VATTAALVVCLVGTHGTGTLFASPHEPPVTPAASASQSTPDAYAQPSETRADELSGGEHSAGTPELLVDLPSTRTPSPFTLDREMITAATTLAARADAGRGIFSFTPDGFTSFAQRGGYRGRGRGGRNGAAQAEIVLGAVASIAGAAVLVYANRPECNTNPVAGGCGYGNRVVGGAVLSGGIVSLLIGAATWR
jgi:hypothetical protein